MSPRDDKGRFVPVDCPECDCGTLRHESDGLWRCDGLVDPGKTHIELQACEFSHQDGKPYEAQP
jgi:hypothetical protein